MPIASGRNDACLCGSGRKFKKCCMKAMNHDVQARRSALQRIGCFANSGSINVIAARLGRDFFGDFFGALKPGVLPEGIAAVCEAAMTPWVYFDAVADSSRTLADMFLESETDLDESETAFIKQMMQTSLRLYRVAESEDHGRLELVDMHSGETLFAEARNTETLGAGTLLFARLRDRGGALPRFIEGGVLVCDAANVAAIETMAMIGSDRDEGDIDVPKSHTPEIFQKWLQLHHNLTSVKSGKTHQKT